MQRANELEALLEAEQAASAEAGKQATAQWEALHERLRGMEAARDGLQTTLARNEEEAARLVMHAALPCAAGKSTSQNGNFMYCQDF